MVIIHIIHYDDEGGWLIQKCNITYISKLLLWAKLVTFFSAYYYRRMYVII